MHLIAPMQRDKKNGAIVVAVCYGKTRINTRVGSKNSCAGGRRSQLVIWYRLLTNKFTVAK